MEEINDKTENLKKLCEENDNITDKLLSNMMGFPVNVFSKKNELRDDSIRELELSEQLGVPIKIQK